MAFLSRGSHGAQLAALAFPQHLVPVLAGKLEREEFDAGAFFTVEQLEDGTRRCVCSAEAGIDAAADVFLVDHAWSFATADAHAQLTALPSLLSRVAAMAGVHLAGDGEPECSGADSESESEEEESLRPRPWAGGGDEPARVLAAAQRLLCFYALPGEAEPTWYLCDEFGSALSHSDSPSFALAPFHHTPPDGGPCISFSIAWPLRRLEAGEELSRDYLAGCSSSCPRAALLACLFRGRSQGAQAAWLAWQAHEAEEARLGAAPCGAAEPADDAWRQPEAAQLRVWTDIDWVSDELRRPDFKIVATPGEADLLWTKAPLDAAVAARLGARPDSFLNQFPGEECLVFKHLLPRTARRAAGATGPQGWLPQTFDAESEMLALIGAHEAAAQPPLWIVKPWNSGRSQDVTVTGSLAAVANAARAGPKVVQRYIAQPLLFCGRKFDLRVLVAVRSFAPTLRAAAWGEIYVRAANKPYDTAPSALSDFQTSFTSMRQGGFEEKGVSEAQLGAAVQAACGVAWPEVRARIHSMLAALLLSAAPRVGSCPRARALYGCDVMLDEGGWPRLLEVTFCPGVERPMASDPAFFDKLFGYCFREETEGFLELR